MNEHSSEQRSAAIRENRNVRIYEKVITLDNVRELARMVWKEYNEDKNEKEKQFEIAVICEDDTSFKSDSLEILDKERVINIRRVICIKIYYKSGNNRKIEIELRHGNDEGGSFLNVTGDEEMWVTGILGSLKDRIRYYKSQDSFILKNLILVRIAFFASGTYCTGPLVDLINSDIKNYIPYWKTAIQSTDSFFSSLTGALILGGLVLGLLISEAIIKKSRQLWPSIEMQIGPEHRMTEKKRRWNLFVITTVLIIPIILSLISAYFTRA